MQLNSSKLPHYFFSLLIEWNIWLVSRFISTKLKSKSWQWLTSVTLCHEPITWWVMGSCLNLFWNFIKTKFAMINNLKFCYRLSPSAIPYHLSIFIKYWTPALPGKLIHGFQKRWKQCFWVFFFKNFLGEHALRPPLGSSRFKRSKGALWRQKCHVRCFHEYVRYFTKLSKSLMPVISVAGFRVFSARPTNPATIRFGSFVLMTADKVRASIDLCWISWFVKFC